LPFRTLSLILCASAALFADQVVLKNGDTLTGSVIRKDGAKLTLKSELLGEMSIPWSAVKSLKSDQDLVVVLPSGESVKGKISTNGDNLEVAAKSAPLAGISAIRDEAEQKKWEKLEHPGLGEMWAGNFDLGLALARGNARAETLTNDFNAARVTKHDKISLHFNQVYASALVDGVSSATASAVRGGWAYSRDLNPRVFLTTLNEYEHDRFQSLDVRAVFGGGAGWNAVKTKKTTLSLQAGGDYERENFTTLTRNSAEVNFGDDLLWKASGTTSVTQSFRIYPNLSDTGQYRMNFDITGVTAIKKWLGWHLTFSDRFVSDPLPGRLRNDVLLSTGLRVSFAK
jgi:putative salt-induced outer membrane protein YdiY